MIIYAASFASLALSVPSPSVAQSRNNAQPDNPIGDLIGAIARASAKSNAKKKWSKVAPEIQRCVNTYLESRKITVDQIIAEGLSPIHEKVAPIVEMCQSVTTAQLQVNYPCNVANAKGQQVPTTCMQSHAKAVNGEWVPISRDDFLRAASNKETVSITDFETQAAQDARLAEEERLAEEAAAKAEVERQERLAREDAARKAQEEERRRFAASPEGRRQAAEQAARERQAEMKRQAEARAAARPLSPAQARSMLRVWPAKRWSDGFILELNIQALQPSVKITSVRVNRGSCEIIQHYWLPLNLKYGQTLTTRINPYPTCNIISAEIGTSKGIAYFSFIN
jgi:hypothetical protein